MADEALVSTGVSGSAKRHAAEGVAAAAEEQQQESGRSRRKRNSSGTFGDVGDAGKDEDDATRVVGDAAVSLSAAYSFVSPGGCTGGGGRVTRRRARSSPPATAERLEESS